MDSLKMIINDSVKTGISREKRTCLTILAFLIVFLICVFIRPLEVNAATTVELEPITNPNDINQYYNLTEKSDYKKYGAFYVDIKKAGIYGLRCERQTVTKNTMVRIDPPKGETVIVYLQDVNLAPDDTAPGIDPNRAAVEIGDSGGTVTLFPIQDEFGNTFVGQGHMPAIRKDNTTTKLIFDSKTDSPGKIVAKADPDGFRTCAIGCYSPNFAEASAISIGMKTTGNIEFKGGIIEAHGSYPQTSGILHTDYDGGAAIGANGYGSVNGITVSGGHIIAYPGDPGAAGIGTSACCCVNFLNDIQKGIGSTVKNITINGGKIDVIYYKDVMISPNDSVAKTSYWGAAAIGGGWRSDVDGITINGGEINIAQEQDGLPWVGIGGGGESNSDNIVINGGTIRINARFTGIGGGYAIGETSFDIYIDPDYEPVINEWFGECQTLITGGDIDIKVKGEKDDDYGGCIGIGGWKNDAKNDYVEITGGDISVDVPNGAVAIGAGSYGRLRRITIRGGHIDVKNHVHETGHKSYKAVIGAEISSYSSMSTCMSSTVEYIEFTGGTVIANYEGQLVGGYKVANKSNPPPTDIIINGGNLVMNLADGMQPVSNLTKANAADVHLQTIELAGGKDENLKAIKATVTGGNIPLKHANGDTYQYGLHDVITRASTPHLYFWVPADATTGEVDTSESMFSDLDAKKYYGIFKNAGGTGQNADVAFYPPIPLNLIAEGAENGSAEVLYGANELSQFDPPNVTWLIESYNESEEGTGANVLSGSGAFETSSTKYINNKGRWIFAPADSRPDLFTDGLDLYAIHSEHALELSFDKNIPSRTASELEGTMPSDALYDDGNTIILPNDQNFSLKGYTFTGWNTKSDGSGTDFAAGQNCSVSDFRKSIDDPGLVKLYAQWDPIKYGIIYSPNKPDIPYLKDETVEYTYDEPAKFTEGLEWGGWLEQLTGWTRGEDHYAKNETFINFVDFNANDEPQPRTLVAEWMQEEDEVYIHVTTDDNGVENLADSIVLTSKEGTKVENLFEAVPDRPGSYKKKSGEQLLNGTYTVSIGDRKLDPEAAVFDHEQNKASYVELASYTTTLGKGSELVKSVTLTPSDGTDSEGRPYVIAPEGFTLHIEAKADEEYGYTVKGWKCTGTEPEWDPTKASQDIVVKGTSLLTAEAAGVSYTVEFDPNGGEGEMAPQEFRVGEAQKLRKSTFKKAGYEQGWTADAYHWNKKKDGSDRFVSDEENIPAGQPLSWTDGETVTLYAMWHRQKYNITYHDPSGTYNDVQNDTSNADGYGYDYTFFMPGIDKLSGWQNREGYELLGWQIHGDKDGKIYKINEGFKNFCTINDDGSLTGYTMDAVWMYTGKIILTVNKDDAGLDGLEADIKLNAADGTTVYNNYFVADPVIAGRYVYKDYDTKPLAAGTYTISINGFEVPDGKGTFDYDPSRKSELPFDYYTVKVISDDYVTATVNGSTDDAVVFKGSGADIDAVPAEGCSFDGWSWLGAEGKPDWQEGKDESVASQRITVNKTLELTAHAAGIVYKVTFDANDSQYPGEAASGTMEDQDMVYGEPQKLFKNNYMRKGYSFSGWNTKADGSGTRYKDKESVKDLTTDASTPVVLYARWEPRSYKITYIDPYRWCKTAYQTVKYDETVNLLAADDPGWQPEGHTLAGWEGKALGSFYAEGQQVTNFCTLNEYGEPTGNTVYASWADEGNIRVTIILDNQGVQVDPDDIELVSERDGTTYKGCFQWSSGVPGQYMFDPSGLGQGGSGGTIPDGDYKVHVNNYDSYGLADVWMRLTYDPALAAFAVLQSDTVTIEAGDNVTSVEVSDPATGISGSSVVVEYGKTANISAVVDKEGYHFDRYIVSGSKPDMDESEPDQEITVKGPVALKAQAAPNVYSIHYDANGGEGERDDQAVTYDKEYTVAGDVFTRVHYRMTGWNTTRDGSGTALSLGETTGINLASGEGDVVTLYAQWVEKPKHSLTFDLGGGTLDGKKGEVVMECYEDDVIDIPKAPTRKGYDFEYWKGSKYYPGDKYTVEDDHSFTAVWTKKNKGNPDDNGDNKDKKDKKDKRSADTGDETNLTLWLIVFFTSASAVLIRCITYIRRRAIARRK